MRVNEQVELTAIHTMWMREHNRVALRLHSINPKWDDERLFQEARRIVIAELQHMAFNEFLPVLLGTCIKSFVTKSQILLMHSTLLQCLWLVFEFMKLY